MIIWKFENFQDEDGQNDTGVILNTEFYNKKEFHNNILFEMEHLEMENIKDVMKLKNLIFCKSWNKGY